MTSLLKEFYKNLELSTTSNEQLIQVPVHLSVQQPETKKIENAYINLLREICKSQKELRA